MRERYLEGEKVFLSPVEETDVSVLRKIKNQEFVRKFMSSCLPQLDTDVLADIKATKASGSPYFLIFLSWTPVEEPGEAIGYVKLEILSGIIRAAEIHIAIAEEDVGRGYGKEVIDLMTDYAFNDLNLHSVRALIREKNYASQKAFESQGYQRVGTLPEWSYYDGGYHDCYIYDCIPRFRKK